MAAPNDPYKDAPPPYSPQGPPAPGWAPPPQQYGPPPQQYGPPSQQYGGPHQQYGPPPMNQPYPTQPTVVTVQPVPTTQVIVVGGCPKCRVGVLEDTFTCCGIFCCILFFPLGLICLFTMKDKRCTNCGASY